MSLENPEGEGLTRREFLTAVGAGYLSKGPAEKTIESILNADKGDLELYLSKELGVNFTREDFTKILRKLFSINEENMPALFMGKDGTRAVFFLQKKVTGEVYLNLRIEKDRALLLEGVTLPESSFPQETPRLGGKTT